MCNTYVIKPKRGAAKGVAGRVADAIGRLPSSLVRKSDPGVVMRADGRVELMRWGFPPPLQPLDQQRTLRQAGGRHVGGGFPRAALRHSDVRVL